MVEPTPPPEPVQDDFEPITGPPRWVKVVAVIAAALLVLFLVLQLTGQGAQHGPGRHGRPLDGAAGLLGSTSQIW